VRDFVVEHNGEHRGKLNLKRGGLLPIAAIGRFVTVVTGDARGSTIDRLRRGVEADVLTQDESDTLIGAFEQVYDLLLRREITAVATGAPPSRFIAPQELDTLSRRHLRESFRAIAAVQGSVEASWLSRLRD
jgi:CBS domain-containing protein